MGLSCNLYLRVERNKKKVEKSRGPVWPGVKDLEEQGHPGVVLTIAKCDRRYQSGPKCGS